MTRRQALAFALAAPQVSAAPGSLRHILDPSRGCALLLHARTGQTLASNQSPFIAQRSFPPGSVVKPLVLASLIRSGKLRPNESFFCPGSLTLSGRRMDCSHPRLGTALHVDTAIAYSCNCFVANMARRFLPGELAVDLRAWGINTVPPVADQTLQALGEASILVSPFEVASSFRRLAGAATPPVVLAGLEGSVEYGTGQLAAPSPPTGPSAKVAGKTGSVRGTAQNDTQLLAWFAGFLPSRAPDVVVTVMLAGRRGGSDAAPVAREILEAWRSGRL